MTVEQLNEKHLELLSLTGDCTGSSESALVKCPIVGNHVSRLMYAAISTEICDARKNSVYSFPVQAVFPYCFTFRLL